ncbi:hypothetical protein D3C86_1366550 [compost metagenome]
MREDAEGLNALLVGGVDQGAVGAAELGVETAVVALVGVVGPDHPVQAAVVVRGQSQFLREGVNVVVEIDIGLVEARAVPVVVF